MNEKRSGKQPAAADELESCPNCEGKVPELPWSPEVDKLCECTESETDLMKPGPFRVVPRIIGPIWSWVRHENSGDESNGLIVQTKNLRSLPPEPKKREWRPGDLIFHEISDTFWLRDANLWRCIHEDHDTASDDVMGMKSDIYLGNLMDWLADGKIIVALTEEEIWFDGDNIKGFAETAQPLFAKIQSALDAYRKRKGKVWP